MTRYTRRASLGLGLGLLATACGGGGSGGSGGGSTGGGGTPAPSPTPSPTPAPAPTPTASGSIAASAAAKGISFGSVVAWSQPNADAGSFANPDYAALLERDAAVLVAENEMKWEAIRPTQNTFDFARGDDIVAYARRENMRMRGHTLLWYVEERFPGWLESYDYGPNPRAEAERIVREHVTRVADHYRNDIASWDVVNEAIDPATGNLRRHSMSAAVNNDPSLLDLAFRTARETLPTAELVYNDYMDWGTPTHRQGVLELLRGFRDRGVPVDTLGIQSHIGFYSDGSAQSIVDYQTPFMREWLDDIVALGYKLKITEMDINDRNRAGTIASRDADAAVLARGWLDLLLSYDECDEVLLWGMCDRYSWLQDFGAARPDGTELRPCPYDSDFQPKPLRDAYIEAFEAASAR